MRSIKPKAVWCYDRYYIIMICARCLHLMRLFAASSECEHVRPVQYLPNDVLTAGLEKVRNSYLRT